MAKWAILIGVDRISGRESTTRCGNDVRAVKGLLQQKFGFELQCMLEMLVSQHSSSEASFGGTVHQRTPTYDNIINAFRKLESLCSPGDLVYFHFSGVVAHAPSVLPEFAAFPLFFRDFAFIPADFRGRGEGRLLHDLELSSILYRLVQRDVEVVAILDCRPQVDDLDSSDPWMPENPVAYRAAATSTSQQELREMHFVDTGRCGWFSRLPSQLPQVWLFDPHPAQAFSMITSFNIVSVEGTSRGVGRGKRRTAIYERRDQSGMDHGILTDCMTKVLQENEDDITMRELYLLTLKEATSYSAFERNQISLVGNGLRLFPGSRENKEHGSLVPISAPTNVCSWLPGSNTRSVQRCSLQGMLKESKEERQVETSSPGMKDFIALHFET